MILLLRYGGNKMYKTLKKYIPEYIAKKCKVLNLPVPIIELCEKNKDIFFKYNENEKTFSIVINLGELCYITKIKNDRYIFEKFVFKSIKKRINFILAHEIGHYFLHKKFLKHSVKLAYSDDFEKSFCNQKEYRDLRSEFRADKIAKYLVKDKE
jgi:Zn-dependent peptidase ImmA (M78 family)